MPLSVYKTATNDEAASLVDDDEAPLSRYNPKAYPHWHFHWFLPAAVV